jgi:simple sugar transport system permease protein
VLFDNNVFVYLMFALVAAIYVGLFHTRWGLRTRAVGEHPKAADTVGIRVLATRYRNVIMAGVVAGIGGAYFTLGSVGRFDENMTAGRGFIGLAAMIFGRWNPVGAFLAALVFGFADSLQTKLSILNVPIPSEFLLMAPYLVTIFVVAGAVRKARPPAAENKPYVKD